MKRSEKQEIIQFLKRVLHSGPGVGVGRAGDGEEVYLFTDRKISFPHRANRANK